MPDAVTRGSDGYLRVTYDKLGLKFRTYRKFETLPASTSMQILLSMDDHRKAKLLFN